MGEVDVCSLQCFSIVAVISRTEGSDGDRRVCGPCGGEGGGGSGVEWSQFGQTGCIHVMMILHMQLQDTACQLVREIRSVGVYTSIATWP